MGRSGYFPLLALRGLVHGALGLVGGVGFLVGLVCLILFLMGKGLVVGLFGAAGLVVWYGMFRGRWEYDRAILRRVPEGECLHLY